MNVFDILNQVVAANGDLIADWIEELTSEGTADISAMTRQLRKGARQAAARRPIAPRVPRAERRAAPGQSQARQAKPATAPPPSAIDIATAACILGELTGIPSPEIIKDEATRKKAIRAAARKCHPDKGGANDAMVQVTWAMKILDPRSQGGNS